MGVFRGLWLETSLVLCGLIQTAGTLLASSSAHPPTREQRPGLQGILTNDVWQNAVTPVAGPWASVAVDSSGRYAAAVLENSAEVYVSVDYGANWLLKYKLPDSETANIVSDFSGQRLVVAQNPGYIYMSSNGGADWTFYNAGPIPWTDVTSDSTGQFLVATADSFNDTRSGVYASGDYGVSWRRTAAPEIGVYRFVTSDATGKYLAAAVFSGGI
jgi:hypothetical protein